MSSPFHCTCVYGLHGQNRTHDNNNSLDWQAFAVANCMVFSGIFLEYRSQRTHRRTLTRRGYFTEQIVDQNVNFSFKTVVTKIVFFENSQWDFFRHATDRVIVDESRSDTHMWRRSVRNASQFALANTSVVWVCCWPSSNSANLRQTKPNVYNI